MPTGTNNNFTDETDFAARVGLIIEPEKLRAIGAPDLFTEETGMFETEDLDALLEFCRQNPQFHIATLTSDGDDLEGELLKGLWAKHGDQRDWDALPENAVDEFRIKHNAGAITISNCVRRVNRLNFYLSDGDADETITLTEIW